MSVRWDNSILGKLGQHTLGRAEALGKTILYTGFTVAQIGKIAVKALISIATGGGISRTSEEGCDTNGPERINQFSPQSLGKDCIILAGFASKIFSKGLSGVIFAPKSTSRSLVYCLGASGRVFFNAIGFLNASGKEESVNIYNHEFSIKKIAKATLPKASLNDFLKTAIFG